MTDDTDKPKTELTPTNEKPVRERRVSKRIAEVVRLLLTGECRTQKAAAERVGMNAGYLSEALKKPHVRVFIERRTRETIANGTLRASARLVELLDAAVRARLIRRVETSARAQRASTAVRTCGACEHQHPSGLRN